jgi:membrane protease YdiL (CAAX protease family)
MPSKMRFPLRFFIVTFAWTWLVWSSLILMDLGIIPAFIKLRTALIDLGGAGPAIGAMFSIRTLEGRRKLVSWLKSFLDFRWGWKAWIIPVIVFFSICFFAWLIPEFFGELRLPSKSPISSLFLLPVFVVQMIVSGGGEEFGWRGYILDPLEERLGSWGGNLVLAVAWGLWHLPLWFIQGTNQTYMNFGGFLLLVTGLSFTFRRFRIMAGKRPSASIWFHALSNSFSTLTPFLVLVVGAPQPRFWIFVLLNFTIGIGLMVQESLSGRRPRVARQQ